MLQTFRSCNPSILVHCFADFVCKGGGGAPNVKFLLPNEKVQTSFSPFKEVGRGARRQSSKVLKTEKATNNNNALFAQQLLTGG